MPGCGEDLKIQIWSQDNRGSRCWVRYGFIKIRMKVVNFIKKIFIKNHFHQKPQTPKT